MKHEKVDGIRRGVEIFDEYGERIIDDLRVERLLDSPDADLDEDVRSGYIQQLQETEGKRPGNPFYL